MKPGTKGEFNLEIKDDNNEIMCFPAILSNGNNKSGSLRYFKTVDRDR